MVHPRMAAHTNPIHFLDTDETPEAASIFVYQFERPDAIAANRSS